MSVPLAFGSAGERGVSKPMGVDGTKEHLPRFRPRTAYGRTRSTENTNVLMFSKQWIHFFRSLLSLTTHVELICQLADFEGLGDSSCFETTPEEVGR